MQGRILIVDDSEVVRNFHSYILRSRGYKVTTAVDGADALDKLFIADEPWSLVITDINMPNMDGYTLIERIREYPEFENLPIIIISTEDESQDKERGFEAGADVYIVKPTDPEFLLESIRLLIGE